MSCELLPEELNEVIVTACSGASWASEGEARGRGGDQAAHGGVGTPSIPLQRHTCTRQTREENYNKRPSPARAISSSRCAKRASMGSNAPTEAMSAHKAALRCLHGQKEECFGMTCTAQVKAQLVLV